MDSGLALIQSGADWRGTAWSMSWDKVVAAAFGDTGDNRLLRGTVHRGDFGVGVHGDSVVGDHRVQPSAIAGMPNMRGGQHDVDVDVAEHTWRRQ